jgi:hypothetical protein
MSQIEAKVGSMVHVPEHHRTQGRPMGRWIRGHGEGRRWPGLHQAPPHHQFNRHSAPLALRLPQHDPLNLLHSARGRPVISGCPCSAPHNTGPPAPPRLAEAS